MHKHAELLRQVHAAREAAYRVLGALDEEAIVPIAMFGPRWPAGRQAWRVIHRPNGHTLLATDGLSDPFVDRQEPSTGFGLELVVETDEPIKDVTESWLLLLLQRVTSEVVDHQHVRDRLRKGLFSMEVSGKGMPKPLVTSEGRVAVLLGIESSAITRGFITPTGEVRLVTLKALMPVELAYLLQHMPAGRVNLAQRFAQSGDAHLSRAQRRSVV